MDYEIDITPFDPDRGLIFKYGMSYRYREREIAEFEQATGFKLPRDFLDLIGEWCEGGFDGDYRVASHDGLDVHWNHLLMMRLPVDGDQVDHDALALVQANPECFGMPGSLRRFPFGSAYAHRSGSGGSSGHLAFDVERANAVVYLPDDGGPQCSIAASFRAMLLQSSFVHYG